MSEGIGRVRKESEEFGRMERRRPDMWPFRKKESLLDKGVFWVYKNLGEEYVNEFRDKYEKMEKGIPIGDFFETALFVELIATIKREG